MANFIEILKDSNKKTIERASDKYKKSIESKKELLLEEIENSEEVTERQLLDLLKMYMLSDSNKYENEINMIYIMLAHQNLKDYVITAPVYPETKEAAIEMFIDFGPLAYIYGKYFNCLKTENNLYTILMNNIKYDTKTIDYDTLKEIYNKYKNVKFINGKEFK